MPLTLTWAQNQWCAHTLNYGLLIHLGYRQYVFLKVLPPFQIHVATCQILNSTIFMSQETLQPISASLATIFRLQFLYLFKWLLYLPCTPIYSQTLPWVLQCFCLWRISIWLWLSKFNEQSLCLEAILFLSLQRSHVVTTS